jgi:hypothetical protein
MSTAEDLADSTRELVGRERPIGLDRLALAVDPLGLYGVKPRALLRKKTTHDPHALFLAVFDLSVVFAEPPPDLPGYVPAGVVSQMSRRTFLPSFSSSSQHHERNCVVMELTGLPSTNLIHMPSSLGR